MPPKRLSDAFGADHHLCLSTFCRWPGVTKLKDWHEFPQWTPTPLATKFPNLEPAGVNLMEQMFVYDPAKRITVRCLSAFGRIDLLVECLAYEHAVEGASTACVIPCAIASSTGHSDWIC